MWVTQTRENSANGVSAEFRHRDIPGPEEQNDNDDGNDDQRNYHNKGHSN